MTEVKLVFLKWNKSIREYDSNKAKIYFVLFLVIDIVVLVMAAKDF